MISAKIWLMPACRHEPNGRPPGPDTGTTETDEAGAEPWAPGLPLPPSATVTGVPGLDLGNQVGLVPGHGSDPGVLILGSSSEGDPFAGLGYPVAFFVSGQLGSGSRALLDVWDGTSGLYREGVTTQNIHLAGDVDQDGHLSEELYLGPILGRHVTYQQDADAFVEGQVNGDVGNAVGDINGDGLPELVGMWRTPTDPPGGIGMWMLLFSPHPDPIDLSVGLELGWNGTHFSTMGRFDADLDGDGLTDLVDQWDDRSGSGEGVVGIWYGADLLAAWETKLSSEDEGGVR